MLASGYEDEQQNVAAEEICLSHTNAISTSTEKKVSLNSNIVF
jgi:hypothetical protein